MKKNDGLVEEEDYTFLDKEGADTNQIKILSGEFKDVIFHFESVKLTENPEVGNATLSYLYKLDSAPTNLNQGSSFQHHLGDILASIISRKDIKIGKNGK